MEKPRSARDLSNRQKRFRTFEELNHSAHEKGQPPRLANANSALILRVASCAQVRLAIIPLKSCVAGAFDPAPVVSFSSFAERYSVKNFGDDFCGRDIRSCRSD